MKAPEGATPAGANAAGGAAPVEKARVEAKKAGKALPLAGGAAARVASLLAALARRAAVDRRGDVRPARVGVEEAAAHHGGGGGEREHDGREHSEVVVEVARLGEVARLEGHLREPARAGAW